MKISQENRITIIQVALSALLLTVAILSAYGGRLMVLADKAQRRNTSCPGNLKVLWMASLVYQEDWGEFPPPREAQVLQHDLGPHPCSADQWCHITTYDAPYLYLFTPKGSVYGKVTASGLWQVGIEQGFDPFMWADMNHQPESVPPINDIYPFAVTAITYKGSLESFRRKGLGWDNAHSQFWVNAPKSNP